MVIVKLELDNILSYYKILSITKLYIYNTGGCPLESLGFGDRRSEALGGSDPSC